MRVEKIEVTTTNGVKVNLSRHITLSPEEEKAIEMCALELENVTGRTIHAVYLNPDRDNPDVIYDYKFVFKKQR